MASTPLLIDSVAETTTTTGTGTVTLLGAKQGYQAWSVVGNTKSAPYVIRQQSSPSEFEVGIGTYTSAGTTLSRDKVYQSSNANALVNFSAGTKDVFLVMPAEAMTPQPSFSEGRLTLTSGTPVTTSDVTGATSIFWSPYLGPNITLWDGSGWENVQPGEKTLAVGTLTAALPYDVFGFLSGGTLSLESLAWTNTTTRATTITIQDGRYCKNGDKTRLYLGTFYTTATTTTEDSEAKRFLFNMYNRMKRTLRAHDSTVSWTYTSATFRQANANAANQVEVCVGLAGSLLDLTLKTECTAVALSVTVNIEIGEDSTTTQDASSQGGYANSPTGSTGFASQSYPLRANLVKYPAIGYHKYVWLEALIAGATTTFYGDESSGRGLSGISGFIEA